MMTKQTIGPDKTKITFNSVKGRRYAANKMLPSQSKNKVISLKISDLQLLSKLIPSEIETTLLLKGQSVYQWPNY